MKSFFKMSETYAPTLKEVPAEAELASHRLLYRSGMIRKSAAGIYSFLPLGFRVLSKIEDIVREEMAEIGCQELLLPVVQPAELWKESGRWDVYGPELARFTDRHGRGFCLGPTHEEIITSLIRADVRSYRELPLSLFQINMKFRDEIRPRFGLLRGREFIMKDAYSFHETQESLQEHYDLQAMAYGRICERLGLVYRPVEADSGQIGGKVTTEFMALADAGEAELVYCDCGYAANTEVGEAVFERIPVSAKPVEIKKISTPGTSTISALAKFLDVEESQTVKALAGKTPEGILVLFFVPGNRDLNMIKATNLIGDFALLEEEDFVKFGIVKGFIGPVGVPAKTRIIADGSLENDRAWIVGANEKDFHFAGASIGRDFNVEMFADLTTARAGDSCPQCGAVLDTARGIEVSQVFQLGKRYSESMNATYLDANGKEQNFFMGCYGVGISRSLAAVIEQNNDEHGIIWPMSIAPMEVVVVPLAKEGDDAFRVAEDIARELADSGIETVFDDRSERAGVKFADADLIGWPVQVVLGKKGYENGTAEVKLRGTEGKVEVPLNDVASHVANLVNTEKLRFN
ncbi:MAG: proline--tRNA ligase [Coriobacteriia bacterium]|nr:proline--tRNA ligase [Coriobacteriia bacterium]